MKKLAKVVLLLLVLVIIGQSIAFAADAWPAYLLTFLLGFGSGHFYLGDGGAVTFLVTDLVSIGIMIGGTVYMMSAGFSAVSDPTAAASAVFTGYLIVGGGALVYSIARIWEMVDVFFAADRAKNAGTVTLVPGIMPRNDGIGLSLTVLY